jgi:SAM-dependent methyltransferase
MAKPETPLHSQEHLSDERLLWWNPDYLELILRRCGIDKIKQIVDIGVGAGHWSLLLAKHAPHPVEVIGVDFESGWLAIAKETFEKAGRDLSFRGILGNANNIPLEDGVADLTTCQTLLMHCQDPYRVVSEMVRVTRSGGCVMATEPINVLNRCESAIGMIYLEPEERGALLTLWSRYHQGRAKDELVDQDIGARLPDLFEKAGLIGVNTYVNDRVNVVDPATDFELEDLQSDYDLPEHLCLVELVGGSKDEMEHGREIMARMSRRAQESGVKAARHSNSFISIGWKP